MQKYNSNLISNITRVTTTCFVGKGLVYESNLGQFFRKEESLRKCFARFCSSFEQYRINLMDCRCKYDWLEVEVARADRLVIRK